MGNALNEEKVLRINCPGFGVSSTLPLGEAKPLAMYEVIVVNPTSILHLFENNSDVIKQIELLQSDGMTSYRYETDSPLENIQAEVDIRSGELSQFLKKGGLLIVFLAPPFTVSGPELAMDNYSWLGDWCPDKPTGPNARNMSATIRGKTIETSADAAQSVWIPYLKQAGLEWSTIIRFDNLTDGVVPLATAGLNKIIAGFKSSGPKAGQVVFLPAPYGAEYDAKLKECIDRWFAQHIDDSAPPAGLQDLSKGLSSLLEEETDEAEPAAPASKPQPSAVSPPKEEPAAAPAAPEPVEEPAPAVPAASTPVAEPVEANGHGEVELKKGEPPQFFDKKEPEKDAEPDQLIKKMQKNVSSSVEVPEWCSKFSFDELDGLRRQHENVEEQIRLAQIKAKELEDRIARMEALKNSLLSADGAALTAACTEVFQRLGWVVKEAMGSDGELWLVEDDKTQAIVRLNYSSAQPNRAELAALAESVITYWGAHEIEPKGILVASSYADKPLQERPDEDFPDAMHDFAKRKNLCLLTTCQLLAVFRDLDISQVDAKKVRENILTTSGRVPEYQFNKKGTTAAKR
ncbi:MAG TPA: hypothetical protein V6D22_10535 [Candidatus Obscuribacterales bacterium]